MLCENCGQKVATSVFMPPNKTKTQYLCGACYKKINNDLYLEAMAVKAASKIQIDKICSNCGLNFKEFEKTKTFGCEECYTAFEEYIKTNILPLFKEQKYLGKKPNLFFVNEEIKNLEGLIEMCLKNGNFQKATIYGKELQKLKEESYGKL